MKYTPNSKPEVCMMTQSTCYRNTKKMAIKGVLWHSTAANNPNLSRYVQPDDNAPDKAFWLQKLGKNPYGNDVNHIEWMAGLNAWIGKAANGEVMAVQVMPWDYMPWGCGAGTRGSCNDGWIQFEICEDATQDKAYLDKVYEEGAQLTAYLCKLYGIDPLGTVNFQGAKVPTILCHQDSYQLGLGSNHADILHWFPKFGVSMEDIRKRVSQIMSPTTVVEDKIQEGELVSIKKDAVYWGGATMPDFVKNQKWYVQTIGNNGRVVINENEAKTQRILSAVDIKFLEKVKSTPSTPSAPAPSTPLTPSAPAPSTPLTPSAPAPSAPSITKGSLVKVKVGAKYWTGQEVPDFVVGQKWFVKSVGDNGRVLINENETKTLKIMSAVDEKYLELVRKEDSKGFEPYIVRILAAALNVRAGADVAFKINGVVNRGNAFTIVEEKNGWGRLKSGAGWIKLEFTERI